MQKTNNSPKQSSAELSQNSKNQSNNNRMVVKLQNVSTTAAADETISQTTINSESSSFNSASNSVEVTVEKYQRLATEYAKMRAQFLVLKKAVIDEQEKNAEQQKIIKSQDQSVRRLEQEMESLQFRNQQLTKRVEFLQNQLNLKDQTFGSKRSGFFFTRDSSKQLQHRKDSRSASVTPNSSTNIEQNQNPPVSLAKNLVDELSMELKTKTEELEHLRQLTRDLEQQRLQQTEQLEHELKLTREMIEKKSKQKDQEMEQLKSSLVQMQQEKVDLETRFRQVDDEFHENRVEIENLKFENKNLKQRLSNFEQLIISKQHRQEQFRQQINSSATITQKSFPVNGPTTTTFKNQNQSRIRTVHENNTKQNKFYNDLSKRQDVIEQFVLKLSEFIYALSTLHSKISQKISIMFALFQKQSNHLYFLDYNISSSSPTSTSTSSSSSSNTTSPIATTMVTSTTTDDSSDKSFIPNKQQQSSIILQHRSLPVMSILRKFRDYMKMGYDTYLVHLEDSSQHYSELKIRQLKQLYLMNDLNNSENATVTDLNAIEQEITETSIDIVETFSDYVSYLNKLNIYLTICLNMWCKQFRDYDPSNRIIQTVLNPALQAHLANQEKRQSLCEKNELLMHSITTCIRIIGQICNYVQLLLSKSLLKSNFLTIFNQFMHRIDALERCLEETKRVFSSKVVLEHDLGVTVEPELKSADDCILSSLVFVSKCVQEIRLMLEMHYFFFVNYQSQSNSPSDGFISTDGGDQNEDEDEDDDDDEDEDEDEDEDDDDSYIEQLNGYQKNQTPASNKSLIATDGADIGKCAIENIEAKLKFCQTRLLQVEKEKEHWSIESQLTQVKLEREQKRSAEMEQRCQILLSQLQQIQSSNNGQQTNNFSGTITSKNTGRATPMLKQMISTSNNASLNSSSSRSLDQTNMKNNYPELGSLSSSNQDDHSQVIEDDIVFDPVDSVTAVSSTTNDPNVKPETLDYFRGKLSKLYDDLEMMDSRVLSYQQDCQSLRQRLLLKMEQNQRLNQQLLDQKSRLESLREEYRTSVDNYETQLQAMSEHMATLNETLASQRDEIEVLKFNNSNENNNLKKSSSVSMTKNLRKSFKRTN